VNFLQKIILKNAALFYKDIAFSVNVKLCTEISNSVQKFIPKNSASFCKDRAFRCEITSDLM